MGGDRGKGVEGAARPAGGGRRPGPRRPPPARGRRLGAGARVAVSYRTNKLAAHRVVNALRSMGAQGVAFASDITDSKSATELVDNVARHFGRLDVLVNNVGDFEWKPVLESTPEEWHAILASTLFSVFYMSKYALPILRRQRWGRVINLGALGAGRAVDQAMISPLPSAKAAEASFGRPLASAEARDW